VYHTSSMLYTLHLDFMVYFFFTKYMLSVSYTTRCRVITILVRRKLEPWTMVDADFISGNRWNFI